MKAILLILAFAATLKSEPAGNDPSKKFIDQMEKTSPENRVPNWEQTKKLMARVAPKVGDMAPEFSLQILDSESVVSLSQHRNDRPVVLVFGSFT